MAKFHINKHGVPAPCHAKQGNCPLGGDTGGENHFDTIEEAQEAADKINEENHGILPGVSNNEPFEFNQKVLEDTVMKEVYIRMNDGSEINGIILESDLSNNSIKVQNGAESVLEIDGKDVAGIQSSISPYFSEEHNQRLREANVARVDFRFSEEDINKFKDKYVEVDYDNKKFAGKVIDTHYNGLNDSGLIIEMNENGPVKHIKNYRLTNIENTGNNLDEHNNLQMIKFLDSEVERDPSIEEYPTSSRNTPSDMNRSYFEAKLANIDGANYETKNISHDWVKELEENSGNSEYQMDDYGLYYEDSIKAENANETFRKSKLKIDKVFDDVNNVDWTKYNMSQDDGVKGALNHMFESGKLF